MARLDDFIGFADKLARAAGYRFIDIFKPSRVALLGK